MNDDNVRQTPPPIKRDRPLAARAGDWPGVIKFAIVAAVMAGSVALTGSAEAAVAVGSSLGALLYR